MVIYREPSPVRMRLVTPFVMIGRPRGLGVTFEALASFALATVTVSLSSSSFLVTRMPSLDPSL